MGKEIQFYPRHCHSNDRMALLSFLFVHEPKTLNSTLPGEFHLASCTH